MLRSNICDFKATFLAVIMASVLSCRIVVIVFTSQWRWRENSLNSSLIKCLSKDTRLPEAVSSTTYITTLLSRISGCS